MASSDFGTPGAHRPGAAVDGLVDEHGSRIALEADSRVVPTGDPERAVGATGPGNWWRMGLLGLLAVVAILFVLQLLNGAPGTDVQPGSPTSEPVVEPVGGTPASP